MIYTNVEGEPIKSKAIISLLKNNTKFVRQ